MRTDSISEPPSTARSDHDQDHLPVGIDPLRPVWISSLYRTAVASLFLALIVVLQWRGGAYRTEFAGYPDEGAHYVTGLMVHDYIVGHQFGSFQAFAENYYLHYPKVAIGHWPPFFYLVEAAWLSVFPASRSSMLFLMALLTLFMAFALYRIVEDEFGIALGIGAGLLLIAMPVIQTYSGMVMADTLVGLLSLLAVLCFARFMERPRWQDASWFGLLAAMTILTKGTGLALALVPPLALFFTGRWRLIRRPVFWLPLAIVVPLCAPWYWLTRHMLPNTWQQAQPGMNYLTRAIRFYTWHSLHMLGLGIIAFAAAGFALTVIVRQREEVKSKCAVLAALVLSTVLLAVIVPAGLEERFLIPIVPAMLVFAVAGLEYIACLIFPGRLSRTTQRLVLILPVLASFFLATFFIPRKVSFGFGQVAEYIMSQPELKKAVLLLSSDAIGDSMFISELAMREARPGHYVLRATKVLCDCSWSGDQHTSRYPTTATMMGYLDHSPIQIVIVDESVPSRLQLGFHRVLDDAINSYSQRWKLLATYPVTRDGVLYPIGVKVYRISGTDPDATVDIDLRRMLNRTIQLQAH